MADTLTEQDKDRREAARKEGDLPGGAPEAATLSGMVRQAAKARQGVMHSAGDEDPQSVRGGRGRRGLAEPTQGFYQSSNLIRFPFRTSPPRAGTEEACPE